MYEDINQNLAIAMHGDWIPHDQWPQTIAPETFGLVVNEAQEWGFHELPDCLVQTAIDTQLPDWTATVFPAIDSTNSWLLNLPHSPAGHLCTAEIQLGGRGRRGRQWHSPFARNLAISLGFESKRRLSELGGLSVVVGLALVDVLEALGIEQVGLKWPNDVYVDGHKICGILVELLNPPTASLSSNAPAQVSNIVIGFGVNVNLTDAEVASIDQPVTDLRRHGVTLSRTELLILFAKSVTKHVQHFDQHGLARFVSAFDAVHVLHGEDCRIVQGESVINGKVEGLAEDGGLRVQVDGSIQTFHGGEVSLRPAAA